MLRATRYLWGAPLMSTDYNASAAAADDGGKWPRRATGHKLGLHYVVEIRQNDYLENTQYEECRSSYLTRRVLTTSDRSQECTALSKATL